MDKNKQCYIFEDLMTLQADGLLQVETQRALQDHLATCPACQAKYASLKTDLAITSEPDPSLDYLKTIKRKNRQRIIGIIAGLLGLFLVVVSLKLFVLGSATNVFHTEYTHNAVLEPTGEMIGEAVDLKMKQGEWVIDAKLWGSGEVFTRQRIVEEAGRKRVKLYTGLVSPWNKRTQLKIVLPSDDIIEVKGDTLYPDGSVVTQLAKELYQARTPYIGDNSAVLNILYLLPISQLSPYQIELETEQAPYGLIIRFEKTPQVNGFSLERELLGYSAVILNLIDNCDRVVWEFPEGEAQTFTKNSLDKTFHNSTMDYMKDEKAFQELLTITRIK